MQERDARSRAGAPRATAFFHCRVKFDRIYVEKISPPADEPYFAVFRVVQERADPKFEIPFDEAASFQGVTADLLEYDAEMWLNKLNANDGWSSSATCESTMKPYYFRNRPAFGIALVDVLNSTPWIQVTDARLECFMSATTDTYTYGEGRGVRTYTPVPYAQLVADIQRQLNRDDIGDSDYGKNPPYEYNVCFLNRYDNASMQLGWHADDSPGMDHEHPIAVVSFGEPREIWWREKGQTGVIPADQRQLLEHGSIFVMPAGMQRTHQHRIPKGDHPMGTRVSLTYRHYVPVLALKIEDYEAGIKKATEGLSLDEVERRYKDMVMNYDADNGDF